jgi:hypothetical protein
MNAMRCWFRGCAVRGTRAPSSPTRITCRPRCSRAIRHLTELARDPERAGELIERHGPSDGGRIEPGSKRLTAAALPPPFVLRIGLAAPIESHPESHAQGGWYRIPDSQ